MKTFAAAAALLLAAPAFAATTFDFDAVTSFASIADFYNGGTDGAGKAGPALGVSFGGDALALANDFDSYFSNAPSPLGVMTPVGGDAAMNAAQGFVGSISFYYASASAVGNAVQVWSGLNGTGSLLASFSLAANAQSGGCTDSAFCHFDALSAAFGGTARSVTFGNAANAAAFDNVTIALVPEPSNVALMAVGIVGLGIAARRRRPLTGMTADVTGLFPTPFMRVPGALPAPLVAALVDHFSAQAVESNSSSGDLSHTAMLRPSDSPLLVQAAQRITPLVGQFGALLFGEPIGWSLKEMWVNVLETGGRQAMHNHANSFVSGVVYLTPTHPAARTVFMKSPGGTDFAFRNDHAAVSPSAFSADKWVSPQPDPGDLVLFPSFLMHAVPSNPGARRITMAFNAIPARLDSWGYKISFSG